ncbi:argonaute 2-like protein [Tanacetum coccineum]
MEEPVMVHWSDTRELSDGNKIERVLSKVVDDSKRKSNGQLQMIICVMAAQHPGYKHLKWVSETKIGVITQCCLSKNANKVNDQFLANLGMKINAKLGGSNVELNERFPCFSSEDRFMFIGADVNHPAASNTSSPSIAAVVGSINWPAATRYAARVSPQSHRQEEIVNFGSLCLDLINTYEKENGVKPNKIVVFRDGVSDGQFNMVLNKEMVDMKKAIYTEQYCPWVTFVVAQKRHTTRLFLNNGRDVGNVPPGTVVDMTTVHPFEFDFYLCSHHGGIGTSKPTHYSMAGKRATSCAATPFWNKFTSDEMLKLVYHLCYIFARCTKPVSLVTPVQYADLVAYRGRMFQEVAMEMESSGSAPPSFDQFFYSLHSNLKDSMFFI